MGKPIIWIDMDGVLCDLFNHVAEIHDVDHYNEMTKEEWDEFLEHTDAYSLFLDLPSFPTSNEIVDMIINYFGEYQIMTSPLNFDPMSSIEGKSEWLDNNIVNQPVKRVYEHDKYKYATQPDGTPNVLIDDWGVNITKWAEAGGIAIKYQTDEEDMHALNVKLRKAIIDNPSLYEHYGTNL